MQLRIYDLIPDYRERCPICCGEKCAVRHGVYYRRVVDRGGSLYEDFPIPRFRCQRRGPAVRRAVTFSVLPAELVSRRRLSLPYMLWILDLLLNAGRSVHGVLDALAEDFRQNLRPWFPEPPTVFRLLHLFSGAYVRLRSEPFEVDPEPIRQDLRAQARWVLRALTGPARAAPIVITFHSLHFPRLLLQSVRSTS